MKRKFLEDRLIDYATEVIILTNSIIKSDIGIHLAKQLGRSGTSVALNYGEAQGAESQKDFIQKMKVVLKELRESYICLKLIDKSGLYRGQDSKLSSLADENNQLIAIFVKSISTAQGKKGSGN